MLFWKKKKNDITIQCSICEWKPDGGIYWACSCRHKWNTFKTKGKCPKCKTQWKDTYCPGCGKSTPHKDWYKTKEDIEKIESTGNTELRLKKKSLETRLINYGIKNYRVAHLPYLDYSNEKFQTTYNAGCRMVILYAIAYSVHDLDERPDIVQWLKNENIWDKVSPNEKDFFNTKIPDDDLLMDLSWRLEGALPLAWCFNKVQELPKLDINNNQKTIDEFQKNVPKIGATLTSFLSDLKYRNLDEIHEENLLNELATTYFRDLIFKDEEDNTKIDRYVSYERHQTLNWLRQFMDIKEWDKTDTST